MTDIPADLRKRIIEDLDADEKLRPRGLWWRESDDGCGWTMPSWNGRGRGFCEDDTAAALLRDAYMRRLAEMGERPEYVHDDNIVHHGLGLTRQSTYNRCGRLAALQAAYRSVKEAATDGDSAET